MTEEYIRENLCKKVESSEKGLFKADKDGFASGTKSFFRWLVHFSLTTLVVLVVGVFFQVQIIALQRELTTVKLNFSGCEKETSRNLRKRSSTEHEDGGPGIQAAHLQGTFAFQHVEKQGKIGPWSVSSTQDTFVMLRKQKTEIEITQAGVYYVYAQVYYLTSEPHNSFQILTYNVSQERKNHRSLVTCSSQGRNSMGETSCFTGFTGNFHPRQRLYLNQIEQNRIIHFTNGSSYFGLVLLKKNAALKPKT